MLSKEDLALLLSGWVDGDIDFIILVPNPEAGEEWKLLKSEEMRDLAGLISARMNDVVIPQIQLGCNKEQAARMMGIAPNTLETLLNRNEHPVPSFKVGRRTIVPLEPLKEWMRDEAKRQLEANGRYAGYQ